MPGKDPRIPDAKDSILWGKIENMSTNTPEFDKMTEKEILFRILQTLLCMEIELVKIEAASEVTAVRS